ncbi:MAG: hypothetical protein U5K54_23370 [Cytophagales bacterium]|nr:hypothetical protein [Cytophagales bacterium]
MMQSKAKTADEYIETLPDERAEIISALRTAIKKNLPKGFEEIIQYGMITYVVLHKLYPAGYHVNTYHTVAFYESRFTEKSYSCVSHGSIRRSVT